MEHKQSSNIFSQETLSENIHSYEGNLLPDYVIWLEEMIGAKQTVGSGGCLQDGVEGGEHGQDQVLEGVARAQGGDGLGKGGGGEGEVAAEGDGHVRRPVIEVRAQGCDVLGGGGGGEEEVAAEGGGHVQRPVVEVRTQGVEVRGGEGGGGQGGFVHAMVHQLESSVAGKKFNKFVKPRGRRGVKKDTLVQARISCLESKGGLVKIVGVCESGKRKSTLDRSDSPGAKLRKLAK